MAMTKEQKVEQFAELMDYGFSEEFVKSTGAAALQPLLDAKRNEYAAKSEAEQAKASKRTNRKSDADKVRKRIAKFLESPEATETSQIIAEVINAPWKGAKELKEEIAPDSKRTFSSPVHAAKTTLHALEEMGLLDPDYMDSLKRQAGLTD